jgi:hypothetical protein
MPALAIVNEAGTGQIDAGLWITWVRGQRSTDLIPRQG